MKRAQRRKRGLDALGGDLEDALRTGQVLERMLAEIDQRHAGRHVVGHQVVGRPRDEDLAAMAGLRDARRPVHVDADQAGVRHHRLAGVDAHAHQDPHAVRPGLGAERLLAGDRCRQRRTGGAEREVQPVAGRAQLDALVGSERVTQDAVMGGQDLGVTRAE
jgi:hypothetical protein